MQPVYAVQFEVKPHEGKSASDLPDALQLSAVEWVADWYRSRKALDIVVLPTVSGTSAPMPRHSVEVTNAPVETGERWWKLVWAYPDERDDNLFWQSQILIAHAAGRTEFTFILRLSSAIFEVTPASVKVRPPRIVRDLVGSLPCFLGPRRLPAKPATLARDDVHDFVRDILKSPERRLPVVVVSPDRETGAPLAEPGPMSERLMGFAEVFVLADRWAAYSLIDEVGKPFACYNGAVRVYWPGFHTPRDPGVHFVYKAEQLAAMRKARRPVEDVIFDRLRFLSVMRIVEGPVTAQASAALQAEARRKQAARTQALTDAIAAGEADVGKLRAQLEEMQRQYEAAQDRITELEKEIETQRQQWANWQQYMAHQPEEAAPEEGAEEPEFRTVLDALKRASVDFGRRLEVLDRARRSAEESRYKSPVDVYRAFEAIRELAGTWFESKAKRGSIGPWEDFFRRRGFKFTMHESQTTMGKFGRDRTFTHQGGRIAMEKHITLGGGDPDCMQIYFEIDEKAGKFLIGYCGVHLPYARGRT